MTVQKTTGLAPTELVTIEGDAIVIRVSLDALVFATEHGCLCTFSKLKNDFRTVLCDVNALDAVVHEPEGYDWDERSGRHDFLP